MFKSKILIKIINIYIVIIFIKINNLNCIIVVG